MRRDVNERVGEQQSAQKAKNITLRRELRKMRTVVLEKTRDDFVNMTSLKILMMVSLMGKQAIMRICVKVLSRSEALGCFQLRIYAIAVTSRLEISDCWLV